MYVTLVQCDSSAFSSQKKITIDNVKNVANYDRAKRKFLISSKIYATYSESHKTVEEEYDFQIYIQFTVLETLQLCSVNRSILLK